MRNTIVIGFGNTLRRDDGAGVAAAEKLAAEYPEAVVLTAQELHPELAETLSSYARVVFLDASVRTTTVSVTRVLPDRLMQGAEGHALSPSGVISLCSGLYGHTPDEALLVEIPAFDCGFVDTKSPGTLRMIDCGVQLISELLAGKDTSRLITTVKS